VIFEQNLLLVGRAELASPPREDEPMAALFPVIRNQVESLEERTRTLLAKVVKEDFFGLVEEAKKRVISSLVGKGENDHLLGLGVLERWNVVAIEEGRAVDWLVWDGIASCPIPTLAARLRLELSSGKVTRIDLPDDPRSRPILLRAHELVPRSDPPTAERPLSGRQLRAIGVVLDEHHISCYPEAVTRRGLDRILESRGLKVGRTGIIALSDPDLEPQKPSSAPKKRRKKATAPIAWFP
jgi:hypothetical protein